MNILSIDLGTKTGWAIENGCFIESGVVDLKCDRFSGGGMRFLKFERFLDDLFNKYKIGTVYFESVRRHIGTDAAHSYGAFWGTLTSWCEKKSIPYEGIPVQSIKKFATGKGNAKKESVIESIKSMGYSPVDDNEADAIALLLLAKTKHK